MPLVQVAGWSRVAGPGSGSGCLLPRGGPGWELFLIYFDRGVGRRQLAALGINLWNYFDRGRGWLGGWLPLELFMHLLRSRGWLGAGALYRN